MIDKIKENLNKVIIGKKDVIEKAIVGLLSNGHMLIEDVPGTGKTTLAKAIAISFGAKFKRIQFTPDLLPSDITGITVYDLHKNEFRVRFGPVFANFLLADEINRGTPKTQSALLEAMAEYKANIDGVDYPLEPPFIVIATENPIEYEGTFPLPEAQLDRFIMRFSIGYPEKVKEKEILFAEKELFPIDELKQVCSVSELIDDQEKVKKVFVHDSIADYIVDISNATRNHSDIYLGASPRGTLFLMRVSQAWAFIEGRDFVIPDDVKKGVLDVFNHRILLKADARLRGVSINNVLEDIVEGVKVPVLDDFSSGEIA
jgi:MoxR-like ATPase